MFNREEMHVQRYHIQTDSCTTTDLSILSLDYFFDLNHKVLLSLDGSDHYLILIVKIIKQEVGEPSKRFETEKVN